MGTTPPPPPSAVLGKTVRILHRLSLPWESRYLYARVKVNPAGVGRPSRDFVHATEIQSHVRP